MYTYLKYYIIIILLPIHLFLFECRTFTRNRVFLHRHYLSFSQRSEDFFHHCALINHVGCKDTNGDDTANIHTAEACSTRQACFKNGGLPTSLQIPGAPCQSGPEGRPDPHGEGTLMDCQDLEFLCLVCYFKVPVSRVLCFPALPVPVIVCHIPDFSPASSLCI